MKRILMICFAVLMLCQATAFAKHNMPEEEFCIGGLTPGCTFEYVKSIYGEPSKKDWKLVNHPRAVDYYLYYDYDSTLFVRGISVGNSAEAELNATVMDIVLTDNSLSTSSGITVGMPYQAVVAMFGEGFKRTHNGKTRYGYGKGNGRGAYSMGFDVDNAGIITQIGIYNGAQ